MRLWIDLDNSPHVHFFAPIVQEMERRGIEVLLTARSFGQTEELAHAYGLAFTTVGAHRAHKHSLKRVTATVSRALSLARFARGFRPDAAVSHGSRALVMAAWMLRVPSMTIYDYEFVSSSFFSKASQIVMVPDAIPAERLASQGVNIRKVVQYPGFKEEVYLYDIEPCGDVLQTLKVDRNKLLITLRPPATWAHYHNPKSEVLFRALIDRLRCETEAQVIVLPRTRAQGDELRTTMGLDRPPFVVLDSAVDGLNLMRYSDAVFSGGGTMIREAALLGVPAFSIFAGTAGSADAALERRGLLRILREPDEIRGLQLTKLSNMQRKPTNDRTTRDFIFSRIAEFTGEHSHSRQKTKR